jgi:hypothetical protein
MIIISNAHMKDSWKGFKKILFAVRSDMASYNINEVSVKLTHRNK